jgi:hypothetical protein
MRPSERPSAAARDRFLQAAASQPAFPPHTWTRRLVLGGGGALAWLLAMVAALGIRHDWHDLPAFSVAATVAGLCAAALVSSSIALARGRSMVGAATEILSLAAWGIPLLLFLLVVAIDPSGPSTVVPAPGTQLLHAWPCATLVTLVALPLVGIGLYVLRGLFLSRPGLVGASLGLAAATWAHLLLRIHCPMGGAAHAILGHLLPSLPLMALGAWALRRRR